jgi:hypothetical protein
MCTISTAKADAETLDFLNSLVGLIFLLRLIYSAAAAVVVDLLLCRYLLQYIALRVRGA